MIYLIKIVNTDDDNIYYCCEEKDLKNISEYVYIKMNDSNELLKLKLDLQNIKSIPEHEKNPCSLEYINGHKIANSNLFGPPTDRSASEGSMAESEESIEKDSWISL